MHIETERLMIRELMEQDAEILLEIKNDKQVMKYHPTFFESAGNESMIDSIKFAISFFKGLSEKGIICHEKWGNLYAVCLKNTNEVIGVITINRQEYVEEWHMGWYFISRYTGKGYASEAAAAVSDYFLEALSLDYIAAGMRDDNPASFRTAQKSGFKLIEKRTGFDYNNADCNAEDFNAVSEYFNKLNNTIGSSGYYFHKLNKNRKH